RRHRERRRHPRALLDRQPHVERTVNAEPGSGADRETEGRRRQRGASLPVETANRHACEPPGSRRRRYQRTASIVAVSESAIPNASSRPFQGASSKAAPPTNPRSDVYRAQKSAAAASKTTKRRYG